MVMVRKDLEAVNNQVNENKINTNKMQHRNHCLRQWMGLQNGPLVFKKLPCSISGILGTESDMFGNQVDPWELLLVLPCPSHPWEH